MLWTAGQLLYGGRYSIQQILAEGGFGITYLATDRKGTRVVIKTLKHERFTHQKFTQQQHKLQQDFEQEAYRLAVCQHPHIVQIKHIFYEQQLPCIAMEYVAGKDLWQQVTQQGVLSETEALHYIRQIGDALTVMHDNGLLHRDVKPQNIIVRTEKSEAVLIDFGIAREFIPNLTQTHTQSLTPGFAPIEQYALQAKRGAYTDIYALAATLYYLLTGQVPLPAPARAANIPLDSPQQLNSKISNLMNQAILKGMAFNPEKRPASVQEWLALLPFNQAATYIPQLLIPNYNPCLTISQVNSTVATSQRRSAFIQIDYRKLQNLLALGKWQAADEETSALMLKLSSREADGWMRVEDIQRFPTSELRIIDQLWLKHSRGCFGFTVQKQIWQSLGGTQEANYETLCALGDRLQWRVDGNWLLYENFTFDSSLAPVGHLPTGYVFSEVGWWVGLLNLFYRLD